MNIPNPHYRIPPPNYKPFTPSTTGPSKIQIFFLIWLILEFLS